MKPLSTLRHAVAFLLCIALCISFVLPTSATETELPLYNEVYILDGVTFCGSVLIEYPADKTDTSYTIPLNCTCIQGYAFSHNPYLKQIDLNLNEGLYIERRAFYHCDALDTVLVRTSSVAPEENVFSYCSQNISVHVDIFYQIGGTYADQFDHCGTVTICTSVANGDIHARALRAGYGYAVCGKAHIDDGYDPVSSDWFITDDGIFYSYLYKTTDTKTVIEGICVHGKRNKSGEFFSIDIPEMINTYPVRRIEITGSNYLTGLTIPKVVEQIHLFALPFLTSVFIDADNPTFKSVDNVILSKDGTKLLFYPTGLENVRYNVPEGVKSISSDAFRYARIETLELPSTFCNYYTTATGAVILPSTIRTIEVSPNNPYYSAIDGVLYNKQKTTLIQYPYCKTDTVFTIPYSVESVEKRAFYYNFYLNRIELPQNATRTPLWNLDWTGKNSISSLSCIHIPATVREIYLQNPACAICTDALPSTAANFAISEGCILYDCSSGHGTMLQITPDDPRISEYSPQTTPTFFLTSTSGTAGDIVRMTLRVRNNTGIIAAGINIIYDSSILTLVSAEKGADFSDGIFTFGGNISAIPYTALWEDSTTPLNHTNNGELLTYYFRIDKAATAGVTQVCINYDIDSTYDVDLNNVAFNVENGTVSIVNRTPGDVNDDGVVNLKDVTVLRRFLAGGWNVSIKESNADVNADGILSLKDATVLSRYLSGGWNITLT